MNEDRGKKNLLIGGLLVAIIAMAVGYAALAQQLTINGTATISSTWDVEITSITGGTPGNDAGSTPTVTVTDTYPKYTATTATFDVSFQTPGDYIEYDVVVENKGSLAAKLVSATTSVSNDTATNSSGVDATTTNLVETNGISYEVTIGGKSLTEFIADAGSTGAPTLAGKVGDGTAAKHTVHVKVYWDKNATTIPNITKKTLTITLNYAQA